MVHYPLYVVPWGSVQWLVGDAYAVTILHRFLIAIAASLLVLAVLRRFLTPGIAWAMAVWWTVVPINYDNLYEVHLFALLPGLVAVLLAFSLDGLRMRAAVFGVLLLSTVLMRTELAVALAIWTGFWIAYELRLRRAGDGTPRAGLRRALGIPVLIVALLALAVLAGDPKRLHVIHGYERRLAVNTCENFAYGYEQRHSDFHRSPFAGCGALSEREFGTDLPTLTEAVAANPRAMGEHFLWNARLVPYGVQLMLFDAISAGPHRNPDFVLVQTNSEASLVGLIAVLAFVASGMLLAWRDRSRWWKAWIAERAWGWLALGSIATSAALLMLWERPRPSYLFALTVLILVVVGMCAMQFVRRWPRLAQLRAGVPVAAVLLLLLVPPHYGSGYQTPQLGRPGRPIKRMVDRLDPFRYQLRARTGFLATYSSPGCFYIGGDRPCKAVTWKGILNRPPGTSLSQALNDHEVRFIYGDEDDMLDPPVRSALARIAALGWRHLEPRTPGADWVLLGKPVRPVATGSAG